MFSASNIATIEKQLKKTWCSTFLDKPKGGNCQNGMVKAPWDAGMSQKIGSKSSPNSLWENNKNGFWGKRLCQLLQLLGRLQLEFEDVLEFHNFHMIEGSLEVKLPTIWTDEKQSREEAERRERLEERRVEEKESEERRCRCAKR